MEVQLAKARTALSWEILSSVRFAGPISFGRKLLYITDVPLIVTTMAKLLRKRRQMIMANIVSAWTNVDVRNRAWLCVHCNTKLCDETHDTSHNVPTFASFLRLLAKCLLQSLLFYCLFIFISRLSFLAGSTWTTRGLVAHWALLCLPLFNTISYNNSVVLTEFLWNVLLCYFY